MIRFFETCATELFVYRWWLLAGAIVALGCVSGLVVVLGASRMFSAELTVLFRSTVAAAVWAWGLFLVVQWFHPTRGAFRLLTAPGMGGLRDVIRRFQRLWATVFLAAWFLSPLLLLVV